MDDEIIEGEVIEPKTEQDMDSLFAAELNEFEQDMNDMKDAYLLAADYIRWSGYRDRQAEPVPKKPPIGYMAIRRCGNMLISIGEIGKRILENFPTLEETQSQNNAQTVKKRWPEESGRGRSATLSPPDLSRFGGAK